MWLGRGVSSTRPPACGAGVCCWSACVLYFCVILTSVLCESDQHESPHPTVPAKVQPLSEPAAGAAIKEDSLADSSASTLKPVPGGYEERRRSIRIGAAIQSSKVLKLFLACICLFAASLLRFSKCVAGAGNGADGPLTQGSRRRRLAAGGPPDGHEHSLEEECKQLTTGGLSGGAQSTASNATGGEPSSTSEGGTPIYSAGEQGAGSVALPDLDNDEPTREMLDLLEDAEKAADVVGDLTNITQALQSVLYGPEDIPLDLVLSTSAEQAGLLRDALDRLSALLPSRQRIFTLLADPGNRGHPREKLFARAEFDMKLLSRALYDALADARVYTHLARPPLGTPGVNTLSETLQEVEMLDRATETLSTLLHLAASGFGSAPSDHSDNE